MLLWFRSLDYSLNIKVGSGTLLSELAIAGISDILDDVSRTLL